MGSCLYVCQQHRLVVCFRLAIVLVARKAKAWRQLAADRLGQSLFGLGAQSGGWSVFSSARHEHRARRGGAPLLELPFTRDAPLGRSAAEQKLFAQWAVGRRWAKLARGPSCSERLKTSAWPGTLILIENLSSSAIGTWHDTLFQTTYINWGLKRASRALSCVAHVVYDGSDNTTGDAINGITVS